MLLFSLSLKRLTETKWVASCWILFHSKWKIRLHFKILLRCFKALEKTSSFNSKMLMLFMLVMKPIALLKLLDTIDVLTLLVMKSLILLPKLLHWLPNSNLRKRELKILEFNLKLLPPKKNLLERPELRKKKHTRLELFKPEKSLMHWLLSPPN